MRHFIRLWLRLPAINIIRFCYSDLFFVGSKIAPILVERKTGEDVANSIFDGRWERQQRSMRKAQYVLGGGPKRKCQICYIIEGDPSRFTVHGGYGKNSMN